MSDTRVSTRACPLCLNEDSVKGFKVQDVQGRWWSYCWADHSEYQEEFPDGERLADADKLWFYWESGNRCLIEGPTTGRPIQVEFKLT